MIKKIYITIIIITCFSCGKTDFTKLANENKNKTLPSPGGSGGTEVGEPSGGDAVSASTNWSHKADELSPKLNPLAGAAFIKPPEINNYGGVGLSYPIEVTPGRKGIQPGVGITYSSSGGDGLVGIGWSLGTGLGVISRTTVNGQLYYDHRDIFTFNGKKLVKVAGPSGSEYGTYRMEIESGFSRFELTSADSGGVWKMYDKSGAITVFGEDITSRIYQPNNNLKTFIWNFSRVYDLNGNYMDAVYDTSDYGTNHVLYLREIRYTGNYNEGQAPKQYVKFIYKVRGESYVSKAPGFIMKMNRLLDSIEVGWNGNKLWQYDMVYETSENSGRQLLKAVESTRNTTKPEFFYQPAAHLFVWQMVNNPDHNDSLVNHDSIKYFEGDFNGDGISDMVFFNTETGDWKAAEGRRDGGYNFKTYGNKFRGYDRSSRIQFFKGNVTGDYNGDGRSDIAFYLPGIKEFWVAEHNGRTFEFKKYGGLNLPGIDIMKCEWFTGDFDGNGLSDAVLFNEPTGEWILMRNMGGYFDFIKFSSHFRNLFRGDYSPDGNMDSSTTSDRSDYGKARGKVQFLSGDFNGDGRTDIAIYDSRDGKWWVAENYRIPSGPPLVKKGGDEFRLEWKLYKVFNAPEQALFGHDRFSGDFNGDGFSDFLLFDRSKGEWIIGETGDGTVFFKMYSRIPENLDVTRWFQGDFNGDGRTDIGFFSKTDNNFWIGEATVTGFRYRIYNNMSYGPDPYRIMTTPLPRDEVKIESKKTVMSRDSSTTITDYQNDANFHTDRGEMVFPGHYTASGGSTPEFLIYKRESRKFYFKSGSGNLSEISGLPLLDLSSEHVKILNSSRAMRSGSKDGLVYYNKTSSYSGNGHTFRLIHNENGNFIESGIANFSNGSDTGEIENFNIDESLYLFDEFNGSGNKEVLVFDDQHTGGARFMLFDRYGAIERTYTVSGPSGLVFNNLFRSSGTGNDRDRRSLYRFFSGRFTANSNEPAQVLMVDMTGESHKWYLGVIDNNSNNINFDLLSGNTTLEFEDTPNSLSYRVSGGYLVYQNNSSGQVKFFRMEISGMPGSYSISQTSYNSLESGTVFSNEYDYAGNPVVQSNGSIKRVKLGLSGFTLEDLTPDNTTIFAYTITRGDLLTRVYPFQWIQGDYNGDGKTDIGIFNLKEPKWYFAVTQGTVPDLMEKVNNGIGGTYEFEYANSTSFDSTGDDGIPHLPMNYKVCVKMAMADGQGWSTYNIYEYKKGYAFSGFINGKKETDYFGFGEFRAIDPLGSRSISLYNNVPYSDFRMNRALAGAVKETKFIGWDQKEYARTVNKYLIHTITPFGSAQGTGSFLVEPVKVEKYLKGVHTEKRTSNIELVPGKYEMKSTSESVTDLYSDGVHSPVTVTGYSEFDNIESTNEIRLIIKKNLTGTSYETSSNYEYDGKGNLTKETLSYSGSGLPSVSSQITNHEYDGFGNRVKSTNLSGSPSRITEKLFDSELHQFTVEERIYTDAGGFGSAQPPYLSTKYVINYGSAFGGITQKTDANGNISYFDYDDYGRLMSQSADTEKGIETVTAYSYGSGFPLSAKAIVNTGNSDPAIQTRSFADGFGRAIHTVRSAGIEPGKRYTKTGLLTYDTLGRVTSKGQTGWAEDVEIDEFKPDSRDKYPTHTEYDASGRVKRVELPIAEGEIEATSISYKYNNPWEVVESHSVGRNKRTVKNSRGQVLYIEDSGTGDPSTGSGAGTFVSAKMGFVYDVAGNRVKKMDLASTPLSNRTSGGSEAEMNLNVPSGLFSPGQKDTSGSNIACWRYDAFGRVRESSDPDLGYRKNEYSEFGDIISTTDALGRTTTMAYDRLGRMTEKHLPSMEGTVVYQYDNLTGSENALGKLVRINDPAQRKDMSYDKLGRIKRELRIIKNVSSEFETRFEYDLLNRTKKIYYPKEPETNNALVSSNKYGLAGITGIDTDTGYGMKSIITGVKYNEFGQMTEISRGNGTVSLYDYDIKGRLYGLITTTQSNNTGRKLQDTRYVFKADNSIKSLENRPDIDASGSNQSTIRYEYTYDGLNRLVHALGTYEKIRMGDFFQLENKKFELGYLYAPSGNLTGKTVYDPISHSPTDAWSYAYTNHAVTSIDTSKYGTNRFQMTYDAAGNMTGQRDNDKNLAKAMEYDSRNRIRKVTDPDKTRNNDVGEYWYDDGGFRVRKVAKRESTRPPSVKGEELNVSVEILYPSMYFGMERQINDHGNVIGNTSYAVNNVYMNGVRIAALMPDGKARYYLTDHVDSVKVVVDEDGNAVTRMEYLPYGETWFQENKSGTEEEHNPKFNSQELDKETGYYYYNARHYDLEIGRFVTADNVVDGERDTQGWNRYSYVKGNPIQYKDPTGHEVHGDLGTWIGSIANAIASKGAGDADGVTKGKVEGNLQEAKGDKIRPNAPLKQYDPSLKDVTNMSASGCCYRSSQNVAESILGRNLTADEIKGSVKELQQKKLSNGKPVVEKDMTVNSMDEVINDTFRRLGDDKKSARVNFSNKKDEKPVSSIMFGDTNDGGQHYIRGDEKGNKQFDPGDTEIKNVIKYPVFIDEKK